MKSDLTECSGISGTISGVCVSVKIHGLDLAPGICRSVSAGLYGGFCVSKFTMQQRFIPQDSFCVVMTETVLF